MNLSDIKDAFDRVAKKQKLSYSKTQEVIDQLILEIEKAIEMIKVAPESSDNKEALFLLIKQLKAVNPFDQLDGAQKELNGALNKCPKVLEKTFHQDISKAYREMSCDPHTVNHIIASHLYREGLFDIGDCFISESREPESAAAMKAVFKEIYQIRDAMRNWDLEPALKWAAANSAKLKENGSDLLLKLHSLQFVEILKNSSREAALNYARTCLSPFASDHVSEIQKLMSCLLWYGKLESCPYSQIVSPYNWKIAEEELVRQFCNLVGQPCESPLSVTIAAGVQTLPPLLKFMTVMAGKKHEWQSMKQLPVPVELDREFQFHSIFVCPVSKDQSTDENPPMMLSCGHVICRQSINKMSKNSTKTFKCPYCPTDIDATQCKQLYF